MIHVGIVAGESSGDRLGAALIAALHERYPEIKITGMAGPAMMSAGCEAIAHIDELSVMGLVEVVRKYPQLHRLRERVYAYYLDARPDVFIGIDVPDFVMNIESRLHAKGMKTVHYVAPQVWAWRSSRAKKIAGRLDLLLVLFPFEESFFGAHGVNTTFIGHPLADQIPLKRDVAAARDRLGLKPGRRYVALMPGSRKQEWSRHVDVFLNAASLITREFEDIAFVAGAVNSDAAAFMLRRSRALSPAIDFTVIEGQSHDVLGASDAALVASGTVTMEGMFAKTPMVVGYKMAGLSYYVMKRMVKIPHIAMPNVLAGRELVPEFVQSEMTPERLAGAISGWLGNDDKILEFETECAEMHNVLRRDAAARAASAVLQLAGVSVECG